jgi:hypothetical protein
MLAVVRDMSIEPQFQNSGGRRADRLPFAADVQFRRGTLRASVQIRDISTVGARISGVFLVHENDQFYLRLPLIEPIAARVIWAKSFEFGCKFERPINAAVLAAITASAV